MLINVLDMYNYMYKFYNFACVKILSTISYYKLTCKSFE